ncbi:MAG: hypothetical protein UZ15_CFX003001461, partial [Chloroflexi bacterium OLB15]
NRLSVMIGISMIIGVFSGAAGAIGQRHR